MRTTQPYDIREYVQADGSCPFREWLASLDVAIRARVQARVMRIESGNFGDHKQIDSDVHELRLDFGPGYRLYFARQGKAVVILLCGGDKKSQRRDIKTAQNFYKDFQQREKAHG
jgi:putative addiction module killer protein